MADNTTKTYRHWRGQPFTVITEEKQDYLIDEILKSLFINTQMYGEKFNNAYAFIRNLLFNLKKPFTLVYEPYYVDRSFRDVYYMYFSNQHFESERNSQRLSFFCGKYDQKKFFSDDEKLQEALEKAYIGSLVINPLMIGTLGRTLISPEYLIPENEKPVYMRLSKFKINIYGRKFYARAFPYRAQDGETMVCAEVALLNLIEYYANSYDDYRLAVPSEITESKRRSHYERVLPSEGLESTMFSRILSEFSFSPRIYDISALSGTSDRIKNRDVFKRLLHYYIESGIPVAIEMHPDNKEPGHIIICIGHGKYNPALESIAKERKVILKPNPENTHAIINSADFYDKYIVVDDNEPVYSVRSFDNLTPQYSDLNLKCLIAPLYKRMFLDASNAYDNIMTILKDSRLGIDNWGSDFLKDGEDVVIRFFMASSASFKRFRIRTLPAPAVKEIYALIPMPRFIWTAELYRKKDYSGNMNSEPADRPMAFGEIILDATSAAGRQLGGLILMHYPGRLTYRLPESESRNIEYELSYTAPGNQTLFEGFRNNLEEIS